MAIITITELCDEFPEIQYLGGPGHIVFGLPIPNHPEMSFDYDTETQEIILTYPISRYTEVWEAEYGENRQEYDDNTTTDDQQEESNDIPKLRTRGQAGNVIPVPLNRSTPSNPAYSSALTTRNTPSAHLLAIKQPIQMEERDGKWYFNGVEEAMMDWNAIRSTELANLDLGPLRVLYSTVEQMLERHVLKGDIDESQVPDYVVSVYVPELMQKMGMQPNANKKHVVALINKIRQYENIVGIIPVKRGKKTYHIYSRVMVWHEYNDATNTISFASPYFNRLRFALYKASLKRDKDGSILITKAGNQNQTSVQHFLIKNSIESERNKRAIEIVDAVCEIIVTRGNYNPEKDNPPWASARTIISKCVLLKEGLLSYNDDSNRNKMLKSAFLKAWELLHTQTHLEEEYINIRFPDTYPTMSRLDMVFSFPHEGRRKKRSTKN